MAQSQDTALTPAGHEPFELPGKPDQPACPVCHTGVLYVIAYDDEALHEQGQTGSAPDQQNAGSFTPSGGSIRLQCFNCGMPQTHALNAEGEK